ncbi:glycoside hydrolase family 16 protein [Cadophora sp. DSE1049]|nr:glycoside hydrolase family 16 protein [Cadophora sp. DSE1049]
MQAGKSSATLRSRDPKPAPQSESDQITRGSSSSLSEFGRPSLCTSSSTSSNVLVIPSPLRDSSFELSEIASEGHGDIVGGRFTTNSQSSTDLPRNWSSNNIQGNEGWRRRGNGRRGPPQQKLRQNSARALQAEQISRPGTPRHIRDLGHDYSRYPSSTDLGVDNGRYAAAVEDNRPPLRTTTNHPCNDSPANPEKWPDDRLGVFDPYCGGDNGFILYPNEEEEDDKFHLPADDDDITFRPKLKDCLDRRNIVSTCGAIFLILGLLCVFVVLPVLTYQTRLLLPERDRAIYSKGPAWAHVNDNKYRLPKGVRKGLIDPDTPESAKTRKSALDDSTLELVFSDEFNEDGRTFYEGDDPYWYAPNFWYGATQDLEWYDPDAVTTSNGTLQLKLERFRNHNVDFRSGMLHSWNHLCFKGGVIEISVSLAGPAGIPGLWPGAWTMGNLGRPGYLATTDGVWPCTYDSCDAGIKANQSSSDGLSYLPGQRLNSCTCKGEDHPNRGTGRGAPEVDILEGSVANRVGVVTQSFQVAPFDVWYRPNSDFMALPDPTITQMNTYCGGPFQQAISAVTTLNNSWYDGNEYQKYAFEYVPGTDKGKIAWFVGEDPTFIMDGRSIGQNGNIKARQVSEEPMSIVLNLGISHSWSDIWMDDLKFPTTMHVDYVRIYQKPGQNSVSCDPEGYPTTDYISKHPEAYQDADKTLWEQTGYEWPAHKLGGCPARGV